MKMVIMWLAAVITGITCVIVTTPKTDKDAMMNPITVYCDNPEQSQSTGTYLILVPKEADTKEFIKGFCESLKTKTEDQTED
jgi:hypothetical protein